VVEIRAPPHATPGADVPFEVVIASNLAERGTLELRRGTESVAKQEVDLNDGVTSVPLTAPMGSEPAVTFEARLTPAQDTIPENNRRRATVFADRRTRLLLVDREPASVDALRQVLDSQGVDVQVQTPAQLPTEAAALAASDLLMLSDVVPKDLDAQRFKAVQSYVHDLGGGLIVLGGDATYGKAAYAKSPLESLLPVKAREAVEVQKKSVLALVLVIDESLSMLEEDRMTLAKQAAEQAVQVLKPTDKVGVLAFSNETIWKVPISPCSDKNKIVAQIRTLKPTGQTHMYQAVERAFVALEQTTADRRHIILLTDGFPAPGDFMQLAGRIGKSEVTLSTVTVGKEAEQALMEAMALRAGGKFHPCKDPAEIPKILVEETQKAASEAARQEFEAFAFRMLPGLDVASAPPLLGYAATDPKPNAEVLLLAAGSDPLLSWWRQGAGITAAFTSDHKGRWGQRWLSWPGLGPFWKRLVRHAARVPAVDPSTLVVQRTGREGVAALDAVDAGLQYLHDAQVAMTLTGPDGQTADMSVAQVVPGRYEARFAATQEGPYTVEAKWTNEAGAEVRQRQTLFVDYPDELLLRRTDEAGLRSLAAVTGGVYDPQPAVIFAPDGRTVERVTSLAWPLVLAALLLFVADVALRRLRS
jgi:Mg-chelatase subunit ChlD